MNSGALRQPFQLPNLASAGKVVDVPISKVAKLLDRVDHPLTLGQSQLGFLLGVLALEEEEVKGGRDESHCDEAAVHREQSALREKLGKVMDEQEDSVAHEVARSVDGAVWKEARGK